MHLNHTKEIMFSKHMDIHFILFVLNIILFNKEFTEECMYVLTWKRIH